MDFRVLNYFVAIAREGSITRAAESLNVSQPALSRQIQDLENRLGKKLLIRGSKQTTLTEEGMLLRKRAEEILELTQKAVAELRQPDAAISGDVWVGGGELKGMRYIAQTAQSLKQDYPEIKVNLISGNALDIEERLEKGLIDFAVGMGEIKSARYGYLPLPSVHVRGLLMRKDSPLALHKYVTPADFEGLPIISPRNTALRSSYEKWLGKPFDSLNIVATFNLIYNATFLVEEGLGYALCLDDLVNTSGDHSLCFIPNEPRMEVTGGVTWKKHQVFSKASQKFLERLREITAQYP